jgi:hypothetical protein
VGGFEVLDETLLASARAGGMCPCRSGPAPPTLIANVPGRTTVNLNGPWRAIVDPFENGKSGFFRNEKPRSKSDRVEHSFGASPALNVPDLRSPTRMLPSAQDYHNRNGLISNRGQRKLMFYTPQKFYKKLADAGN